MFRHFATLGLLVALTASAISQDYGTIKGQVVLSKAPKLEAINVTTDKAECCKDGPLMPTDVEVDAKTKGLKNVIVWLRPDNDDRKASFPTDKIHPDLAKPKPVTHTIDQPKCQFEPRVLAAREGDKLIVKNSATIAHNINYSSEAEPFNLTLPAGKSYELKNALAAQRFPVSFKCDIHPWMAGRIRVFDHPYFATTDAQGNFTIKQVPAGKWRIVYWHENGFHKGAKGSLGETIEVTANGTLELKPIDFEFPPQS
jgi:plastocyanin